MLGMATNLLEEGASEVRSSAKALLGALAPLGDMSAGISARNYETVKAVC
jgi:hypothetical protein